MERTVLTAGDIARALTRMAHEIIEMNRGRDELVLLGIPTRGVALAQRLATLLSNNGQVVSLGVLDVTMYRDDLGRASNRTPQPTVIPDTGIDRRTVVIVDDVLYSGRTIRAALDALADLGRARLVRLAVLVDRGHREFPIRADFVGKNLPSALTERVNLLLEETDGIDAVTVALGVDAEDTSLHGGISK